MTNTAYVQETPVSATSVLGLIGELILVRTPHSPINVWGKTQTDTIKKELDVKNVAVVLSSMSPGSVETALIATEKPLDEIVQMPELSLPVADHPTEVMFRQLGNTTLQRYFEHDLGGHMRAYGRNALAHILARIREENITSSARPTILVVGHEVYLNAIAWALAQVFKKDGYDARCINHSALYTVLNEGDMLIVDIEQPNRLACDHFRQRQTQ